MRCRTCRNTVTEAEWASTCGRCLMPPSVPQAMADDPWTVCSGLPNERALAAMPEADRTMFEGMYGVVLNRLAHRLWDALPESERQPAIDAMRAGHRATLTAGIASAASAFGMADLAALVTEDRT